VKKLNVMAAVVAALMLPVALGPAAAADARVLGEKLDSGLGTMVYGEKLDSGLATMVYGESLDSGLGDLPATYTAAEYMPAGWVLGASLDSGLGDLSPTYTAAEFMPVVVTARRAE
jgi:hypothetical protein